MTTALSVAAIAISVLTLLWTMLWSIYTHRSGTRPRVKVEGAFTTMVYGTQLGPPCLNISATNIGQVPVTITNARFLIRGKTGTLVPMIWEHQSPNLPTVLSPGQNWQGTVELASIHRALLHEHGSANASLQPEVSDSAGSKYASGKWLDVSPS